MAWVILGGQELPPPVIGVGEARRDGLTAALGMMNRWDFVLFGEKKRAASTFRRFVGERLVMESRERDERLPRSLRMTLDLSLFEFGAAVPEIIVFEVLLASRFASV